MIANLQEAFKELVDESDWMDEQTKKVAVQKVSCFWFLLYAKELSKPSFLAQFLVRSMV